MQKFLFTLLLLSAIRLAGGAQNVVSNTNWEMDESGTKVIVTYDLNRQGEILYFSVELFGVLDGIEFKARTVSGDVGPYVRAGRNKKIVWEIFKDVSEADGSLSVKVAAENAAPSDVGPVADPNNKAPKTAKPANTVPVYAGLGGVVTIGGGLLVTGATKLSKAKSEYDDEIRPKYDGLVGPNDPAYRAEYDDVNKRFKSGQLLMAGGGAIIAAGGYILVKRLIDIKKIQTTGHLDVRPQFELGSPGTGPGVLAAGMSIRYKF